MKSRKNYTWIELLVLILTAGFVVSGGIFLWISTLTLPDFQSFEQRKVAESTKIYDRTGEVLLFDVHRDIKRTVVPLSDISLDIRNATIAIEDSEFYDHSGIKPTAILRALITNVLSLSPTGQGGSTITQQVVKNTLLTGEKKIARKIKEAVLAIKLENVLDKNGILALYLNEAPYGGNLYGVEAASLAFFGKEAKNVTLSESAYLAALPKAPTYYSPYGPNVEDLDKRKDVVLDRMFILGFITKEEANEAKKKVVVFAKQKEQIIKAPHFVMFVRDYLTKNYGDDAILSQGLTVTTTLNWEMQQKGEKVVAQFAQQNTEQFNANNAALVAIDPHTGQTLTMVGSKDWFGESYPQECISGISCVFDPKVNVTTQKPGRQPGSAIKPFIYATLFKKGYTPETVLFNLATQFSSRCDSDGVPYLGFSDKDCYAPQNYDEKFTGPVTIREALAQSINIPAVKALYLAGLNNSIETASDLGITTLTDKDRYGLTLVLGGGEVSLLEITSAYGVFAEDGVRYPNSVILEIKDKSGNVLESFIPQGKQVLDKNVARTITDILSDNEARAPAFGFQSPLYIPNRAVAAKTGTTNNFRDAWIIGYTPHVAVGAWAGNNNNEPMEKKVAGFVIAPLWRAFMDEIADLYPNDVFQKPRSTDTNMFVKPVLSGEWRGSRVFEIDSVSGKLATPYTPQETRIGRILTQIHSILFWVDKDNPHGEIPKNPEADPQFELWEASIRKWVSENGILEESEEVLPQEFDDIHTPETQPVVTITSVERQITQNGERLLVSLSIDSAYPVEQIDFFVNGDYVGTEKQNTGSIVIPIITESVNNTVVIRVYDSVKNKGEATSVF